MPAVGVTGVHDPTTVGPLTVVVLQLVAVQLLPAAAATGVQVATATGAVLFVLQVVVV